MQMKEPLLATDQIQANIVPGFRFPFQHLIAVRAADGNSASQLIGALLPRVTTMKEALAFHSERLDIARQSYTFGLESFQAVKSHPVWLNMAIGNDILAGLGFTAPGSVDRSFQLGLDRRSKTLGDPSNETNEGHKNNWIVGGPDNRADILLVVGSSSQAQLNEEIDSLKTLVQKQNELIYEERGIRLPGDKEHFGFRDGVSQPGVRGLIAQNPDKYLTRRRVQNSSTGPEWSSPGTPLVWPGEFIFGYPKQSPNHYREASPFSPVDDFLVNGSFLVFRRLRQDVALFRSETERMANDLATIPEFSGMNSELFQAGLVGRWPDGSPLVRIPSLASGEAVSDDEINYFNFGSGVPDLPLANGEVVSGSVGDPNGISCPFHAHIRKINPRDRGTDLGSDTQTMKMRILRRGIPFGPLYDDEPEAGRGLLFMCFQTSIRDQFELLTVDWVNSTINPEPGEFAEGFDMVLGQNGASQTRERFCVFANSDGTKKSVSTLADWVVPTGGGYFFCPSINSLKLITNLQNREA